MSILKSFASKLLVRVLMRYLAIGEGSRDPQVEEWLAGAWMTPGFRKYLAHRNAKCMEELAGGSGMTEHTRDEYLRVFSRRVEVLYLGAQAKNAWLLKDKENRKKLSTPQKTPYLNV